MSLTSAPPFRSPAYRFRLAHGMTFLLLVGVAIGLRFWHLDALEPFVDEGGNVLTSVNSEVRKVIDPVGQGRPLLAHIFRLSEILPGDQLLRSRQTTAAIGLLTLLAITFISGRCFGPVAAIVAAAFWALCPYLVFFERLALQDPFVTAACALALACFAQAAYARGWPSTVFNFFGGCALGIAILIKISALIFFPVGGLLYLYIQRRFDRPAFSAGLVAVAGGTVMMLFLCLGRDLAHLGENLSHFNVLPAMPESSGLTAAFLNRAGVILQHVGRQLAWHDGYNGKWFWVALALAISASAYRRCWLPLFFSGLWVVQMALNALVYNLPYARYFHVDYLLPCLIFASVAGALSMPVRPKIRNAEIFPILAVTTLLCVTWIRRDVMLLRDPFTADLPPDEKSQYLTGPWSGTGLRRVFAHLQGVVRNENTDCLVVTFAYWRVSCYGLLLATADNPRIRVIPCTVKVRGDLDTLRAMLEDIPGARNAAIFFVFENTEHATPAWFSEASGWATPVLKVGRPDGQGSFELYRADPFAAPALGTARDFPVQTARDGDLWIGPNFSIQLEMTNSSHELVIEGDTDYRFLKREPTMEILVNDRTLAMVPLAPLGTPFRIVVPINLKPGNHEIRLIGHQWFRSTELGPSEDRRVLFIRLGRIYPQ